MPALDIKIHVDGDNVWPDLRNKRVLAGEVTGVALLPEGMQSGLASVSYRIQLPTGEVVIAQTSLALLVGAAKAFIAAEEKHGRHY